MKSPAQKRIALLTSGDGSLVQKVYQNRGLLAHANVALIGCTRTIPLMRTAQADGLATLDLGLKTQSREQAEAKLAESLEREQVDYVFLNLRRLLSPVIVDRWPRQIFSLHHSLLPLYPGLDPEPKALGGAELFFGGTLHLVDHTIDGGPIVGQFMLGKVPGESGLASRLRLYQASFPFFFNMIDKICSQELVIEGAGAYLAGSQYGTLPFNPSLHIPPERLG